GLGPIEQVICNQEIGRAGVPGILDAIGVGMLGPTIIAHGTDEQKARYLGPMLHGDEVWCQLFSEPAAGSDLAAVQSRARQQEDGSWLLNGQKVWTTNAQFASFGLLLARTDPDVPKHKGLTMFIVPIDAPGVTVRGLRQISGEAEFNEVFFDDVALDADAVVGGEGNGWATALTTLMFERVTIGLGSEGLGYNSNRFAHAIATNEDARRDPEVRHVLGEIASELLAVRFIGYRTLTALQKGQVPGPEAGLAKITIVNGAISAGELIADGQVLLGKAARGALSRFTTLEAAREALAGDADALPELWPMAREAGWPGLLIDEEHGGAGLDAFDAMLVLGECGRVLASIKLLGHLVASAILNDAPAGAPLLADLASGERRAAYLPVKPPDDLAEEWTVDARVGSRRE